MSAFSIIVDSSCDLPAEYIKEHDIEVLPMPFTIDGKEHNQGYWQEISGQEYYDALRRGGVAKTSQVSPMSFTAAFTERAKRGQDALCITLSSKLSAAHKNAETVQKEIKALYPESRIHVVDSLNATSGHGLLAMMAVKKREEGLSAGEVASWLNEKKHSCFALFTVDDLMYLHRGGRLSKLSAVAGSMLGIKPVLNIAPDGSLKLKDKVRGRKTALKLLVNQLKRSLNPGTVIDTVMVNHTDCLADAEVLAEMIKSEVEVRHVTIVMMGPIIGAHVGPGTITLLAEVDMTREAYEAKFYNKA